MRDRNASPARTFDVAVQRTIPAHPERVASVMFNPRRDPEWMKAVRSAEPDGDGVRAGARVRRTGRFLGRELRWTTEVVAVEMPRRLHLRIVQGSMRGEVEYTIAPSGADSVVTIRNTGEAPRFAPRWLLTFGMRRALTADLRRLQELMASAV
jgi:uncharacterized protein YndB with AHSA1/START domain